MKDWNQERERLELHMMTSLARSQRALSRIIEAVADHMEGSEELAGHVADNLKTISEYQRALMLKLMNPSKSSRVVGKPGKPWISKRVKP